MREFSLALLAGSSLVAAQPAAAQIHIFRADHVLGTSLEVLVRGGDAREASRSADAARREIDRLDLVLSGWRPDSELSRLNRTDGPCVASPDLFAVIARCEAWRDRTGGAFSGRLGAVEALWREAETTDRAPSPERLAQAAQIADAAVVRLDPENLTIDRGGVVFAVDALAKGYIIDAALHAARAEGDRERGVLVNIGGDIACAGRAPLGGWRIGIAEAAEADNLAPRYGVAIRGGGLATSGFGARDRRVGNGAHPHTLDTASGQSAAKRTVSVAAANATDADALATALGVLPVADGLRLASAHGAEARILAAGETATTAGWGSLRQAVAFGAGDPPVGLIRAAASPSQRWPAGFSVEITYEIAQPAFYRARPPFVAVWIADENGKMVRTLFHLGNRPGRYLDSNYVWWNALMASGHANDIFSVTRPSRPPGRYTAAWDGRTDSGGPAPQGRYTINIETSREHGGHNLQSMTVMLGAAPTSASTPGQSEAGPASVRYGAVAPGGSI